MTAGTRPLTLGEILDHTVQLYRRNFMLLVGIAAPPAAIMASVTGAAFIFLATRMPSLATAGQPAGQPPNLQVLMAIGLVAGVFLIFGIPLLLGTFAVALGA